MFQKFRTFHMLRSATERTEKWIYRTLYCKRVKSLKKMPINHIFCKKCKLDGLHSRVQNEEKTIASVIVFHRLGHSYPISNFPQLWRKLILNYTQAFMVEYEKYPGDIFLVDIFSGLFCSFNHKICYSSLPTQFSQKIFFTFCFHVFEF